jgi:UDP-N-acetylglucosamine/UDP-N-acetylgalactosamine 4-epimerase
VSSYKTLQERLRRQPGKWLVTGAAGFIGSHLIQELLELRQEVVGLDNFATGSRKNLEGVRAAVGKADWARFEFLEADIRDFEACLSACEGVDCVLHQAALGSVPRSIQNPLDTHEVNLSGFLNMRLAAREERVKAFVYASSSAVYGDHPALPKQEDTLGQVLSPYALTKRVSELYAEVFARCYGLSSIGLRYFNVFGPRQDPEGAYAAVVPKWIAAMSNGEPVCIHGDGQTSRDFCYVANVVQANLLAARCLCDDAPSSTPVCAQVFNVAVGGRTTLIQLFHALRDRLAVTHPLLAGLEPQFGPFRSGDIRHAQADITQAARLLGYAPTHTLEEGLDAALPWYVENLRPGNRPLAGVA